MKKFFEGGEYFVLSSYRINAVPIAEDSEVGIELAKTICEDACYLSAAGNGQTSIEIFQITEKKQVAVFIICLPLGYTTRLNKNALFGKKRLRKAFSLFSTMPVF